MREFFRGFIIDPELERKAHRVFDKANQTADRAEKIANDAEKLVRDAKRKMRRLSAVDVAMVAVSGLVGSGMIIGSLMAKCRQENAEAEK